MPQDPVDPSKLPPLRFGPGRNAPPAQSPASSEFQRMAYQTPPEALRQNPQMYASDLGRTFSEMPPEDQALFAATRDRMAQAIMEGGAAQIQPAEMEALDRWRQARPGFLRRAAASAAGAIGGGTAAAADLIKSPGTQMMEMLPGAKKSKGLLQGLDAQEAQAAVRQQLQGLNVGDEQMLSSLIQRNRMRREFGLPEVLSPAEEEEIAKLTDNIGQPIGDLAGAALLMAAGPAKLAGMATKGVSNPIAQTAMRDALAFAAVEGARNQDPMAALQGGVFGGVFGGVTKGIGAVAENVLKTTKPGATREALKGAVAGASLKETLRQPLKFGPRAAGAIATETAGLAAGGLASSAVGGELGTDPATDAMYGTLFTFLKGRRPFGIQAGAPGQGQWSSGKGAQSGGPKGRGGQGASGPTIVVPKSPAGGSLAAPGAAAPAFSAQAAQKLLKGPGPRLLKGPQAVAQAAQASVPARRVVKTAAPEVEAPLFSSAARARAASAPKRTVETIKAEYREELAGAADRTRLRELRDELELAEEARSIKQEKYGEIETQARVVADNRPIYSNKLIGPPKQAVAGAAPEAKVFWEELSKNPGALLNNRAMRGPKTATDPGGVVGRALARGESPEAIEAALRAYSELRDLKRGEMRQIAEQVGASVPELGPRGKKLVAEYLADVSATAGRVDLAKLRKAYREKLVGRSDVAGPWSDRTKFESSEKRKELANRVLDEADKLAPQELRDLIAANLTQGPTTKVTRAGKRSAAAATTKKVKSLTSGTRGRKRKDEGLQPTQTPRSASELEQAIADRLSGLDSDIPESDLVEILRAVESGDAAGVMSLLDNLPSAGGPGLGRGRRRSTGESGFVVQPIELAFRAAWGLSKTLFRTAAQIARALGQMFKGLKPGIAKVIASYTMWKRGGKPPRVPSNEPPGLARELVAGGIDQNIDRIITLTRGTKVAKQATEIRDQLQALRGNHMVHQRKMAPHLRRALDATRKEPAANLSKIGRTDGQGAEWTLQRDVQEGRARLSSLTEAERLGAEKMADLLYEGWEYARSLGQTRLMPDGSRAALPPARRFGIMPYIRHPEFTAKLARGRTDPWVSGLIDWTKRNTTAPADLIDNWFDKNIENAQNRIEGISTTEREATFEFVRLIEGMPDRFKGVNLWETDSPRYATRYAEMVADRLSFEQTLGDLRPPGMKSMKEHRAEWKANGGDMKLFEDTMRSAQGQRAITPPDWYSKGGATAEGGRRMLSAGLSAFRSTAFSGSFVAEAVEGPFSYGTSVFGMGRVARGSLAAAKQKYKALHDSLKDPQAYEAMKALDETFREAIVGEGDFRLPRTDQGLGEWSSQTARLLGNVILSPKRAVESFTGLTVKNAGKFWVDEVLRAGKGTQGDVANLVAIWGYSAERANAIVKGRGTQTEYIDIANRGPEAILAGASHQLSRARLSENPYAKQLFLTTEYAQTQLGNQYRLIRALNEAHRTAPKTNARAYYKHMAQWFLQPTQYLGWKAAQGAMFMAVTAALRGDNINPFSDESAIWNKAASNPLGFLGEALTYGGILGPIGSAVTYATNSNSFVESIFHSTPVGSAVKKVTDLVNGTGPYRDKDVGEKISHFFSERLPLGRIATQVLAMVGLGDEESGRKTDVAQRALYEWRRKNDFMSSMTGEPEPSEFRAHMRRATDALANGQSAAEHLKAALGVKGSDPQTVARSLRARQMMRKGKAIPMERWDEVREYMGSPTFQRILDHDAILEAWAEVISSYGASGATPNGERAATGRKPGTLRETIYEWDQKRRAAARGVR